eukprot:IDg9009t1
MGVAVDNNEMAMALLNGLPEKFDSLICAIDAIGDDEKLFTFEFVLSRCEQEEQRQSQRHLQAMAKSETAALFASKPRSEDEMCVHCHKHRNSNRCYKKYPHLAPKNHHSRNRKALVGKPTYNATESDSYEVCLLGIPKTRILLSSSSCLAAFDSIKATLPLLDSDSDLISISAIAQQGIKQNLIKKSRIIKKLDQKVICPGYLDKGPYSLDVYKDTEKALT